ncbi:MAG: hypothetical protein FWB98_02200 [Defluviitaleaceae bacterium]|nr:hypothetical protein [Defluviitaleaceae bacterium]
MGILMMILNGDFTGTLLSRVAIGLTPILVLVLLFLIMSRMVKRRNDEKRRQSEQMIAEDDEANNARPQEVDVELFFHVNIDDLPLREYSKEEEDKPHSPCMWQGKVLKAAEKKMLHFDSPKTNVELKQMFGRANLEFVANYEENFTNFIHAMRHWAEALLSYDQKEDARTVLEIAVESGSEISQTYTLLADIYAGDADKEKLTALKTLVEERKLPGKQVALGHIEKLL